MGLLFAACLAAAFIAAKLKKLWPGFYKDRVKLILAKQKERYGKAGESEKEGELGRILDSWDIPVPPPPAPAEEKVGMIERLQRLENAKDAVLELLESVTQLEEGAKKTWASDAKELYYAILASSQFLTRREPTPKSTDSAGKILGAARGRLEQLPSELKTLGNERAAQLEAELSGAFEECWQELCRILPAPPETVRNAPSNWAAFFELPVNLLSPPEKDEK